MHKFLWIIFIFSLIGSTCFGLSLVHHQEHNLISCTGTFLPVHLAARRTGTNVPVQLIKFCSWWWTNDSPKHVEPINEKIKIIHKNMCISLVYIHISIWFTVHTASSRNMYCFTANILEAMNMFKTWTWRISVLCVANFLSLVGWI